MPSDLALGVPGPHHRARRHGWLDCRCQAVVTGTTPKVRPEADAVPSQSPASVALSGFALSTLMERRAAAHHFAGRGDTFQWPYRQERGCRPIDTVDKATVCRLNGQVLQGLIRQAARDPTPPTWHEHLGVFLDRGLLACANAYGSARPPVAPVPSLPHTEVRYANNLEELRQAGLLVRVPEPADWPCTARYFQVPKNDKVDRTILPIASPGATGPPRAWRIVHTKKKNRIVKAIGLVYLDNVLIFGEQATAAAWWAELRRNVATANAEVKPSSVVENCSTVDFFGMHIEALGNFRLRWRHAGDWAASLPPVPRPGTVPAGDLASFLGAVGWDAVVRHRRATPRATEVLALHSRLAHATAGASGSAWRRRPVEVCPQDVAALGLIRESVPQPVRDAGLHAEAWPGDRHLGGRIILLRRRLLLGGGTTSGPYRPHHPHGPPAPCTIACSGLGRT